MKLLQRLHRKMVRQTLEEILKTKLLWQNDCLVWTGYTLPNGYGKISRDRTSLLTHRVAYELEHGNIPAGKVVRHTCDNPPCCNVEHLVLGTQADNMRDKVERGRSLKGSSHPTCKLTDNMVEEIRQLYAQGTFSYQQLADHYNVTFGLIGQIIRKEIWGHLT
jgi:hypothetical protein